MLRRLVIVALLAISAIHEAFAFDPKSLKDCRLAFLLGMSAGSYGSKWEVFWGSERENECKAVFDEIARGYAKDIGTSDEELRTDRWGAKVTTALAAIRDPAKRLMPLFGDDLGAAFGGQVWQRFDVVSSYAAGAYTRFGTSSGFQMVDQTKAVYLVPLVRVLSGVKIELQVNPGIPGNAIVILSGGGKDELSDFFAEMRNIREALIAKK